MKRPTAQEFGKKYFSSGEAYRDYQVYVRGWTGRVGRKIHTLTKNLDSPTLLDIGCAHGYLMKEVKETYGMKVAGIEYSSYAYNKRLSSVRSDIKKGDILTASFPKNSFDCVVCFDVVEYLTPEENVRAIRSLVRWSRRYILFTNPYLHSINNSQKQNPDPQRITVFSKKEYIRLFYRAGAKLIGHFDGWHGGDILIFQKNR